MEDARADRGSMASNSGNAIKVPTPFRNFLLGMSWLT
jgi:hypothetical protein